MKLGERRTYINLSSAIDTVIELGKPAGRLNGLGAADALDLEEEVVPDVLGGDVVRVEDGKMADAGEDEVLQCRGRRGRTADHEQARRLERRLACRRPEPGIRVRVRVRFEFVDFRRGATREIERDEAPTATGDRIFASLHLAVLWCTPSAYAYLTHHE